MKTIIKKAEEYALEEINKNGTPSLDHFYLVNQKGQEIAENLKADKDVVMIGTMFMDLKLGECIKENKQGEHTQRSSRAAQDFLKDFDLTDDFKNKIINCIEAHHKTKEYICIEAEICANSDCYKMIHPRGVFEYLCILGRRFPNVDDSINQFEYKLEEKHNILSLDICKKELEKYYLEFKELINKARLN